MPSMSELPVWDDAAILSARSAKNAVSPDRPYAFFVEPERTRAGAIEDVATILLTNRECPFRCLMCDLWKNTLTESVPPGAIAAQIRDALAQLPPARHVKLYNAGSFFDPRAIPPADLAGIAGLLRPFERVIVESHPALVGPACLRFRDLVGGRLEVAMGLETVHPDALERLNKRMTLEQFAVAAAFLERAGVGLRVFVLVGVPFLGEDEGMAWTRRSIAHAFEHGASAVSVIPTRSGNGALEALAAAGEFAEPPLAALEDAQDFGLSLGRGRVFADLWDLERFRRCGVCFDPRRERLAEANLRQRARPRIACTACAGAA